MAEKTAKGKSRKKKIIAIVVIAAVVAAGLFGYIQMQNMASQAGVVIPDTVMLMKTDLESKVTASGNFASMEPVSVGTTVTGAEVEDVFVETGMRVYAGDALAKLKTSDLERTIEDTVYAIGMAARGDREKVDSAQRALNEANDNYNASNRQTQDAINKAQAALDTANALAVQAKAAVDAAQAAYDAALLAAAPGDELDPNSALSKAAAALAAAQADYQKSLIEITASQNALDSAKVQRENTMRSAGSMVENAKVSLDSLKGLDSARTQRSQLETLNENLQNAWITSPISGIVTQVLTEPGQVALGTMFLVEDTETLEISAKIAEYDVIKVEKGMTAHITSNATGDEIYTGVVDFVAPIAVDVSGNFVVKVKLTSPVGQLKPGMTATIEIVAASKSDVFAVPIDAVVTKPDGTKVVYAYELGAGDGVVFFNQEVGADGAPVGGGPTFSSEGPGAGGGPTTTQNSGGGRGLFGGGGGPGGGGPGNAGIPAGNQREIVVKTGMETDYYIEIISKELEEGMLILSDPLGRNVQGSSGPMMMGASGGTAVTYEVH